VIWAERAGSLRRGQDLVNDLVFVIATDAATVVLDALEASAQVGRVLHRETDRIDLTLEGTDVAIHCRAAQTAGALLLQLTGSQQHLNRLQQAATERGYLLDDEGLRSVDDGRLLASTEDGIYTALGLPFIPPELRNEGDEVDAARAGRLPRLVSRANIRGDLHMHTHWSDGRDSIEAMVSQALALGYEYMAITDHSSGAAASRTLERDVDFDITFSPVWAAAHGASTFWQGRVCSTHVDGSAEDVSPLGHEAANAGCEYRP